MKRSLLRAAILCLCLSVLTVCALAEDPVSYTGDILIAVNTNTSSNNLNYGTMKPFSQSSVQDVYIDPDTGNEHILLDLQLPELVAEQNSMPAPHCSIQGSTTAYEVNTEKTILDYHNNPYQMVCAYVGDHCTVWTTTTDPAGIRLSADNAALIGQQFDAHCEEMHAYFGDWYDADGDGKLAIFCYDLDGDYARSNGNDFNGSYLAGYFNPVDLINETGHINQVFFGAGSGFNHMDCVHLDTYPLMGGKYSKPFNNISRSYSTVFHETQHLINFSYRVADNNRYTAGDTYDALDTPIYLDEAFAMAAEHLICGADSCSNRISYFNGSNYNPGMALTIWPSSQTLTNYSNSYLFGQYLRTRYAQKLDDGSDGSTLFKAVLTGRTLEKSDSLSLIAELLETTPQQLVVDFWTAIYLRHASGVHGFAGESWADSIQPTVYDLDSYESYTIGNGGGVFFRLNPKIPFTPQHTENLTLVALDLNSELRSSVVIADEDHFSVTVTAPKPCDAFVTFFDSATNRYLGCQILPLSGSENKKTVDLTESRFDLSKCTWKVMMLNDDQVPLCPAFEP